MRLPDPNRFEQSYIARKGFFYFPSRICAKPIETPLRSEVVAVESERELVRIEHTYTTQQLAEVLQIGRSTLNKYSRSLEENGYIFIKGENEKRAYTEHDIVALRQLMAYFDRGMAYDSAIKSVASQYKRTGNTQIAIAATQQSIMSEALDNRYVALEEKLEKLVEMNKTLFVRLDDQEQYIRRALTDRDAQLIAALREMREDRQQLAAALETEKKKSLWSRLFGK